MKDRQGNTVLTRLNEEILKQLADAGHGRYVASGGGAAGIEQLIPDLARLRARRARKRNSKSFTWIVSSGCSCRALRC